MGQTSLMVVSANQLASLAEGTSMDCVNTDDNSDNDDGTASGGLGNMDGHGSVTIGQSPIAVRQSQQTWRSLIATLLTEGEMLRH